MIVLKIYSLLLTLTYMIIHLILIFKRRNKSIKKMSFFNFLELLPICIYLLFN